MTDGAFAGRIAGRKMVVIVSVADLRETPNSRQKNRDKDSGQNSQVLFGEKVLAYEEKDGWVRVEALDQEKRRGDSWVGYPGWIEARALKELREFPRYDAVVSTGYATVYASASVNSTELAKLSLGTRLALMPAKGASAGWHGIDLLDGRAGWVGRSEIQLMAEAPVKGDELRHRIIETARSFMGSPYFWGGRSFCDLAREDVITGVDCSGLALLAYRVHGRDIPRDAHDQFLKSKKIEPGKLRAADLIFLAVPKRPDRIIHVMLYAGQGRLVEAAGQEEGVRETTVAERLGKNLTELNWGQNAGEWIVYFGSLLP